jgi:hypothetical protein
MGLGENDGVDAARIDRKRRPVLQPQRLEALKQAAVDEEPTPFVLHENFDPVTVPAPPRNERFRPTLLPFAISAARSA